MLALQHIVLHIALCSAAARTAPTTPVAIHLRLIDSANDVTVNRTYRVTRDEEDPDETVEFDSAWGIYRMQVQLPQYNCSGVDFLDILQEHNREMTINTVDGQAPIPEPLLLDGTAPMAFTYVKPTFVIFDKSVTCNKPVTTPLPARLTVEHDRDSYYLELFSDPSLIAAAPVVVALQLRTPTNYYHYVRVPMKFPIGWGGWPGNVQFNVTEDELDGLATEPTGVLLCPKLWETIVH